MSRPGPSVLAPPPFIFLGALAVGLVLQALRPLPPFPHSLVARLAGWCLVIAGLALSTAVVIHFRRAETPVTPLRETRQLVRSGPYRFSRNPDYLGQTLVTAGLGLVVASGWVLAALLPALLLVRYGVIAREERYLEETFGGEYREFMNRVPRWL
ncbi:MAG TPA: isoprenylcysteine carboxylmethyltransferase family protein [Gemmatimonadales bacterium]|nr:isoprenylcysteine carboxylmethyltransferase family protein [Gemmatimonadales bacterium]